MRYRVILLALGLPAFAAGACNTDDASVFMGDGGNASSSSGVGGGGGSSSGVGGGSAGFDPGEGGNTSSGGTPCNAGPDEDQDQDGFSINEGDCNDCDPNVNPNAVEVVAGEGQGGAGGTAEPADENCDGQVDEPPEVCDTNLTVDTADPMDGARAIGLCKVSTAADEWGVADAQWTLPAGNAPPGDPNFDLGHGVLTGFGTNVNVQEGGKMLALSSGTARQPNDPGYQPVSGFSKGITATGHPFGFPKESPSCSGTVTGSCNDGAALQLVLRAPSNANGFRFDFDFYTYEWPVYVCSTYNDFFAAVLEPFPQGQSDGNITFDQLGNPISVNNAFFEVCGCGNGPPCMAGGISFTCAFGTAELLGTGFEDHAATSWLQTQAPVDPGAEFSIRFLAYDSGDGVLDSTALVDNFQWIAEPGTTVGTEPIPDPK